jgi:tetratricopeptide (TPR) repeat protein
MNLAIMKVKLFILSLIITLSYGCSPSYESLINAAKNNLDSLKFEEAIKYTDKAIKEEPYKFEAYYLKGVALFELGKK